MKALVLFVIMGCTLVSCNSGRSYSEQELREFETLQEMVNSPSLEIVSSSAKPMASVAFDRVANSNVLGSGNNAGNINLSSNSNYLRIVNDSVSAFLPFFGEQNFGGGYNGNHAGIEFDGVPQHYSVKVDNKKQAIHIAFATNDKFRNSEHYKVYITLYPNYRSIIRIQSSSRSVIEYEGRFHEFESKI